MTKSRLNENPNSAKQKLTSTETKPLVSFVEIDADIAGQRIDNYLITYLKGVPKSLIYRILRRGEVRVNKGRVKPEYKLKAGDLIRVPPVRVPIKSELSKPSAGLASLLAQSILYEDDDLLIINKPSGLAVHGGSGVQLGLIESLRQLRIQDRFLELIHRLDKDTSGCVMVAKNRKCLRYMQDLLRKGKGIQKFYNALVVGRWPNRRKQVDVALLKRLLPSGDRVVRAVEADTEGAKLSLTEYRVIQHYSKCTLVEAKPITGRTHQIRVHSQYAGHPILGDEKYSHKNDESICREIRLKRLFLHAAKLQFTSINGERIEVVAPLSNDLSSVLNSLSQA